MHRPAAVESPEPTILGLPTVDLTGRKGDIHKLVPVVSLPSAPMC
jgi:hypothetical protein